MYDGAVPGARIFACRRNLVFCNAGPSQEGRNLVCRETANLVDKTANPREPEKRYYSRKKRHNNTTTFEKKRCKMYTGVDKTSIRYSHPTLYRRHSRTRCTPRDKARTSRDWLARNMHPKIKNKQPTEIGVTSSAKPTTSTHNSSGILRTTPAHQIELHPSNHNNR